MLGKTLTSLVLCWVLCVIALPAHARLWTVYTTLHALGAAPSMAVVDGIIPTISNGSAAYEFTMLGWSFVPGVSGFIAGDGAGKIVSNTQPVKFGADRRFYSTAMPRGVRLSTTGVWEYVGPDFPGAGTSGMCAADPDGLVYMASTSLIGITRGTTWTQTALSPAASDLAVSGYGDVAVAGYQSGSFGALTITWFDYKYGEWQTRAVTQLSDQPRPAVAFDKHGDLYLAYVSASELRLSALDMETGDWTDELVASTVDGPSSGTALGFDRNEFPVVAAGSTLAFNRPDVITGAITLLNYSGNPEGVPLNVQLRRKDRPDSDVVYDITLHTGGHFYLPNEVDPGVYDIAFKASHWLRKVLRGVTITEGDVTGVNITLTNGDIDGDNTINFSDYLVLQTQYKKPPGSPSADLNGNGAVNFNDYLILQASYKKAGERL